MTDSMNSQDIELSSWDTLYTYSYEHNITVGSNI